MSDAPFMNPPVKNPELDMVPGMASPLPLDAGPPSVKAAADTSLSLGVALQEPLQWSYDFDGTGTARAMFPGPSAPGVQNRFVITPGATPATPINVTASGTAGLIIQASAFTVGLPTQNTVSITPGGGTSSAATMTMAGTGPLQIQTDNLLIGRAGGINRLSVLPGATAATAIVLSPSGTAGFLIAGTMGFNSTPPVAKPTVAGSRAGNAALASLLTALAATGLLTDGSTA